MKKILSILLVLVLTTACIAASAAGYTLPEKMERQLQVGSGLKGSFVIRANADAELSPVVHALQNAAFENGAAADRLFRQIHSTLLCTADGLFEQEDCRIK